MESLWRVVIVCARESLQPVFLPDRILTRRATSSLMEKVDYSKVTHICFFVFFILFYYYLSTISYCFVCFFQEGLLFIDPSYGFAPVREIQVLHESITNFSTIFRSSSCSCGGGMAALGRARCCTSACMRKGETRPRNLRLGFLNTLRVCPHPGL